MSFPQPRAGRRFDPDQEGKRQVPLLVTNAVFSKLIKLGDPGRKTPVAVAQELFDEAYATRCMGKGVDGSPADRLKPGEALADDLAERLRQQLADSGRETARANIEAEEERQAHAATRAELATALRERDEARREQESMRTTRQEECEFLRAEATKIAAERDHLVTENNGLKETVERLRMEALDRMLAKPPEPTPQFLPCEDGEANGNLPAEPEPVPPAIGRGTVKAVLAMRSMGATAAEIAKDLALLRPIVDQVLRENGA